MLATKKTKWIVKTQSEVAEFFGKGISTVALWIKSGCPGRPGRYNLSEIAKWRDVKWPAKAARTDEDDPLLSASDSPGLERYRLAKAELAELDLKERQETLLPTNKVRDALSRWAALIRRLGEHVGRLYGPEAATTVHETLDECIRIAQDEFNSDSDSDETTPDPPERRNGHKPTGLA